MDDSAGAAAMLVLGIEATADTDTMARRNSL
jgi:hypothetical protein